MARLKPLVSAWSLGARPCSAKFWSSVSLRITHATSGSLTSEPVSPKVSGRDKVRATANFVPCLTTKGRRRETGRHPDGQARERPARQPSRQPPSLSRRAPTRTPSSRRLIIGSSAGRQSRQATHNTCRRERCEQRAFGSYSARCIAMRRDDPDGTHRLVECGGVRGRAVARGTVRVWRGGKDERHMTVGNDRQQGYQCQARAEQLLTRRQAIR